jgi:transaldolase
MVSVYLDSGDVRQIARHIDKVDGVTTNPSLLRKAGVTNYREFAIAVLEIVNRKPVSFEVLADDFETMERQAKEISSWGENVYVKIPVTNTQGNPSYDLIWRLSRLGIKVNVTAILTPQQARIAADSLAGRGILSIFAGRIADTGVDPMRAIRSARAKIRADDKTLLLWASAREVYNVVQAEGWCDIITLAPELVAKLDGFGRNLTDYSLETVKQFYRDAEGLAL